MSYFTFNIPFIRRTLARAEQVNAVFTAVEAGFAKVPEAALILEGRATFGTESGAANAYIVQMLYALTGYAVGLSVSFQPAAANTGASSINLMSSTGALLGAKPLLRPDGTAVLAGDVVAGSVIEVRYDGAAFRLLNVPANSLGFNPVQQGTGVGQLTNIVKIGWSALGLKATVDATDLGAFVFSPQLAGYLPLTGGALTGTTTIQSGVATTTPALQVRNVGANQGVVRIGNNCDIAGGDDFGGFKFIYRGATRLELFGSGVNVIGTLNVSGATVLQSALNVATTITAPMFTGPDAGIFYTGSGGDAGMYLVPASGFVTLRTAATTRLSIDNGGNIALLGPVATSTSLNVGGTLSATGTATLNSTLGVAGATILNSTLYVGGATVLNSTVSVVGAVTAPNFYISGGLGTVGCAGNTRTEYYGSGAGSVIYSYVGGLRASSLDGSGNFTAAGNVTAFSDRRLKTDITPLLDSLAAVERMQGVRYVDISTGARRIGFIAQDMEAVRPEYVVTAAGEDAMKSIAYGNVVADLVEAVKTLSTEVRQLKAAA